MKEAPTAATKPARDLDYEAWADALDAETPPSEPEPDDEPRGPQQCRQCHCLHTEDNHVEAESESCEACKWEYGCEFVPLRGAKPVREYDQPTECRHCGIGPIRPQDCGYCSYACMKDFTPF